MDVALVRWPSEDERLESLRKARLPRLLLVEDGPPPPADDCLEDWARASADEEELDVRARSLRARALEHADGHSPPGGQVALDDHGVLRVGRTWVGLPPVEARLTGALVERLGTVVSRDALARAGWPDGAPGRNALDVHVLRLRRRLGAVGLAIRTVRSRGYLLERSASDGRQEGVNPA